MKRFLISIKLSSARRATALLLIAAVLALPSSLRAQTTSNDSTSVQDAQELSIDAVINACMAMRDAVAASDSDALLKAAHDLKAVGTADFSMLRCRDDSVASLDGHLLFDEAFADSLAHGNGDVYEKSDSIYKSGRGTKRGQTSSGAFFTKTCMVPAGKSTRQTFVSTGHQELAVVAEAGGLITMKVHVTNRKGLDFRKDDTKLVKIGMPQRKTSFELPTDVRSTVELEIVNCGTKDCSCVVISN